MTTALALCGGQRVVTACCALHTPGGLGWCCDIDTCLPCCPECPTCPEYMCLESAHEGWRKRAAEDRRRWRGEWNTERKAMCDIGRAMWWWDRADWQHMVIHPPVSMIVRTSRAVARATWDEVF